MLQLIDQFGEIRADADGAGIPRECERAAERGEFVAFHAQDELRYRRSLGLRALQARLRRESRGLRGRGVPLAGGSFSGEQFGAWAYHWAGFRAVRVVAEGFKFFLGNGHGFFGFFDFCELLGARVRFLSWPPSGNSICVS